MPDCLLLYDLAVSRLRALFPGSKLVRDLDRKLAQAASEGRSVRTPSSGRASPRAIAP